MASDWWGVALALGTAAAQGYMAKKGVDAQKKDAQHAQDEWERAMQMQQQNMYDARNSPFAKIGMTMLDQMLHVYGDQSKGRGGFTLPVDQLSSMLGGFGSFGNAENQQTIAGANPDASTGWYTSNGNPGMGGDSLPPEWRREVEARKAAAYAMKDAGIPIGHGGRGPLTQYRTDSVFDAGQSYGGFFGGGGGGGYDEEKYLTMQRMREKMGLPTTAETVGEGGRRSFGDMAQDLGWRYMLADGSMGSRGNLMGEAAQGAARWGANTLTGGPFAGLGMGALDRYGSRWDAMWNYDNPEASYLNQWISNNSPYNVYNGSKNPYMFGSSGADILDGGGYFGSGPMGSSGSSMANNFSYPMGMNEMVM